MNRITTLALALCILALTAGCWDAFDPVTAPDLTVEHEFPVLNNQGTTIERMARSLAEALADPLFRQSLYEEAAERYTGDTEALYTRLAAKQVGATTWEDRLDVDAHPDETKRLHFYVYGVEYSNPSLPPLVAVGVEDEDAPVLKAFDSEGNEYELDAQVPPRQTVVVVALNERVDENGVPREFVDPATLTRLAADAPGGGGGGGRGGGGGGGGGTPTYRVSPHPETIDAIYLINDNEPWPKGDPEIMMQMNLMEEPATQAYRGAFEHVNEEGVWYDEDRYLFDWYHDPDPDATDDYGTKALVLWWEEDRGDLFTLKIKYTIKGVELTFEFTLKDGDDQMGHVLVNFNDPLEREYNTGHIKWRHK